MSLKHGILGLLTYGSMTGYELMKVFNESLNFFWNAQTSQIYRELDKIEKNQWVSSEYVIQKDKPNKKIFTISDSGKEELQQWLDNHSPEKLFKCRDEMTMRVFFGSEGNIDRLKQELQEYIRLNELFLSRLKPMENELNNREKLTNKPGEKLYWIMGMKRGYLNAESNIKWAVECLEMLDDIE